MLRGRHAQCSVVRNQTARCAAAQHHGRDVAHACIHRACPPWAESPPLRHRSARLPQRIVNVTHDLAGLRSATACEMLPSPPARLLLLPIRGPVHPPAALLCARARSRKVHASPQMAFPGVGNRHPRNLERICVASSSPSCNQNTIVPFRSGEHLQRVRPSASWRPCRRPWCPQSSSHRSSPGQYSQSPGP